MSKVWLLGSLINSFGFTFPTFHLSFHFTEHCLGLRAWLRNKRGELLLDVSFRVQQIQFLGFWSMALLASSEWLYPSWISCHTRCLFFSTLMVCLTDSEAGSEGVLFLVECSRDSFKPNSDAASSHAFGIIGFLGLHKAFQVPLVVFSHWLSFIFELPLLLLWGG